LFKTERAPLVASGARLFAQSFGIAACYQLPLAPSPAELPPASNDDELPESYDELLE
jgi:hypothetical protein